MAIGDPADFLQEKCQVGRLCEPGQLRGVLQPHIDHGLDPESLRRPKKSSAVVLVKPNVKVLITSACPRWAGQCNFHTDVRQRDFMDSGGCYLLRVIIVLLHCEFDGET